MYVPGRRADVHQQALGAWLLLGQGQQEPTAFLTAPSRPAARRRVRLGERPHPNGSWQELRSSSTVARSVAPNRARVGESLETATRFSRWPSLQNLCWFAAAGATISTDASGRRPAGVRPGPVSAAGGRSEPGREKALRGHSTGVPGRTVGRTASLKRSAGRFASWAETAVRARDGAGGPRRVRRAGRV